jgi:NADPH:quinone reductase-like Zn-dependent oxidoreductase
MALQTPDLPKSQRAVAANEQLDFSVRDDFPMPPIADDCVIIKTEFVGLNPVDTKMVGPFVGAGANYGVS